MAPDTSAPLFTGSTVNRRPINLGGHQGSSYNSSGGSDSLVERARKEREGREEARKRERAAAKIQAFTRGRLEAAATKRTLRAEYDALLSSRPADPRTVLQATRLLVLLFGERAEGDRKRVAGWCRAVLSPAAGSQDKTPLLFSLYSASSESWSVLIRQMTHILFTQATNDPLTTQAPLFLEITKILCDPNSFDKWKVSGRSGVLPIEYLLERGLWEGLRKLLLAIPPEQRSHPALPAAIALSVLPLKAFPATATPKPTPTSNSRPSTPATPTPQRSSALHSVILLVLTVPLLPHRIPLASLTSLISALPLEEILLQPSLSPSFSSQLDTLEAEPAAYLLANLLAFSSKRVNGFSSGKVLAGYLGMVGTLLGRLPEGLFKLKKEDDDHGEGKGKEKPEVIVIDDSDDEGDEEENAEAVLRARDRVRAVTSQDQDGDTAMDTLLLPSTSTTSAPTLSLDPRALSFLQSLPSREHLTSVLALSTRYSSTTRPALSTFLIALLSSFPAHRDTILNTIMYSSASSERGGGLLRELYRGYVRSSSLGRLLSADAERGSVIIASLCDTKYATDWSTLILLSELYSRCLLTLGDDEFFDSQGQRNPLSLDEVTGLSGVLRNLAFVLYWMEGAVMLGSENGREGSEERRVVGTRMGVEALRTLCTGLLQQIYARDSRRSFTPEGHWLMTSQFDLASFIQTAIYEDQKLDGDDTDDASALPEDDDGHDLRRRRLPSQLSKSRTGLSKRQLAFVSPRLGVLNNIPFVIPFETRVAVFRQFIENDRTRLGLERGRYDRRKRSRAVIRRNSISEDAYAHLNGLGPALKGTIEIVFINQFGEEESGIDGGGLFKELLTSLSKEAFDTDRGLWLATQEQELYPNPHSYAREATQLSWYTFIGRILGKALYDGILIDVRFASFFLSKWLGRQSYLDDLASLDPELYHGLMILKNFTGDVESELSLNFTVTDEDFGISRTIDLIPGGSEIAVTNENRIQYIYLMSHYRLNVQLEKQCSAFFAGLSEIIPPRFLSMFNQAELRVLVGGVDRPIDVLDLQQNTVYGGWDGEEAHPTIRAFWRVVNSFDATQRSKLVKFVTSCARPPLLGFSELNPKFAIRNGGNDETRLPTASTCVCLLKLPAYSDEQNLKDKLLYAINSEAGFDLS